jgi:hypothetical protein
MLHGLSTSSYVVSGLSRTVAVLSIVIVFFEGVTARAQTQVTEVDELRRLLARGDVVSIVDTDGDALKGRLLRIGDEDIDVRIGSLDVTVPLTGIKSLERPRDSARNGALIGASIGGGAVLSMAIYALAVDANEADEWAPMYLGMGALFSGIGALTGWAIDAAHSKPPIRFDAPLSPTARNRIAPLRSRSRGMSVTVSF